MRTSRHRNGLWIGLAVAGLLAFAALVVLIALQGFPSARSSAAARLASDAQHDATMPQPRTGATQRVVLGGTPAARRRAAVRRARVKAAAKAGEPSRATAAPAQPQVARAKAPTRAAAPAQRGTPPTAAPAPAPAAPEPAPAAPAPAKDPVTQVLDTTKQTVQKLLPAPVQDTLRPLLAPK